MKRRRLVVGPGRPDTAQSVTPDLYKRRPHKWTEDLEYYFPDELRQKRRASEDYMEGIEAAPLQALP